MAVAADAGRAETYRLEGLIAENGVGAVNVDFFTSDGTARALVAGGPAIDAGDNSLAVDINGNQVEVDFLRVGRVSLTYQSVGGGTTGGWDPVAGAFVELPASAYQNQVADGLKVARKQVAPDLITVPVPAPTSGGQ